MNLVISATGVVQRIQLTLPPRSFDTVAPQLIQKFGPAAKTVHEEVQNAMGAKFDQVMLLWRDGDNEVMYSKYAGSVDSSSLYFCTGEDRALLGDSDADRRKDL